MNYLLALYEQAPAIIWLGVVFLGLAIGSFLNVVIFRLPIMMILGWKKECEEFLKNPPSIELPFSNKGRFNLATPNSCCPACKTPIKPWQNLPVFSYLWLRGQCGQCGVKISFRYPCIELLTGLLSAAVLWKFGVSSAAAFALILVWCLIALTMIDIDHQLLPDVITLPLIWLGIFSNLFNTFTTLESSVIGAIAGYLSLWSVYWSFKLLTGKEGMGFGDFKLLAALGAWLGWKLLPAIILLSSLSGAVVGGLMIAILGRDRTKPIPFGPYLAMGGFIALFWGEALTQQYLSMAFP